MFFSRLRQLIASNNGTATDSQASALEASRLMLALEPRYLYDGALVSTGLEGLGEATPPAAESSSSDVAPATEPSPPSDSPDNQSSLSADQTEGPEAAAASPENSADRITESALAATEPIKSEETSGDGETDTSSGATLNTASAAPAPLASSENSTEIVIIDSGVDNSQELIENLSPVTEVYILNADQDGIAQINDILNAHDSVDALHIFSHGSSGNISLGSTQLNSDTINDYETTLADWGDSFADGGDILLYGCNVGSGEQGTAFINTLAELTGTDVAASSDATGSDQGENWNLEAHSGDVTSDDLVSNELMAGSSISLATAETSIEIDTSGNLIITDFNNETDDTLILSTDGSSIFISDANNILTTSIGGATGDGTNQITVSLADFTGGIIVNTMGGDDLLTVDYFSGAFSREITYNGGDNGTAGDTLALTGGSFASSAYSFTNANDGAIDLSGNATLTYTFLEPITSSITATDVTLNYSDASETITITNAGSGQTKVDSTAGESITFINPTTSLTINGGGGADTINLDSLDSSFAASLTINGEDGQDAITIAAGLTINATINGNDGKDTITNNGNVFGSVNGGNGNDTITNQTTGSIVAIYGSQGEDEITNHGYVTFELDGGADNDTITNSTTGDVGAIFGGMGDDTLLNQGYIYYGIAGNAGDDTITNEGTLGAPGRDGEIFGDRGNDTITNAASGTVNQIIGGSDDDFVINQGNVNGDIAGKGGNDILLNLGSVGGTITGGADDDMIGNLGTVADDMLGRSGNDLLANIGSVGGTINGGAGDDLLVNVDVAFVLGPVLGPIAAPILAGLGVGNASAGSLQGGNGDDIIVYSQGSANSSDSVDVDGGRGTDILAALYNSGTFSGDGSGTVTTGTVNHPGGTDVWNNFEGVYILGTLGDDNLYFGPTATVNAVLTLWGDDQVTYYQGTVLDFMDGGDGSDTLTGYYRSDAIINGTPNLGNATYSGPTSPDNWSNFEGFNRWLYVDPSPANSENTVATISENNGPAGNPGNGPQSQSTTLPPLATLYLPKGPFNFDLNGYPGSPYTPGPGSLVEAALNSITGSISANLGSGGTMPGTGSTADTQAYTAEEAAEENPDPENPQTDKQTLDSNSGENQGSSSQKGPTDNNQEQNGDNESKPRKLLQKEGEIETEGASDKAPANVQYAQSPLSDPLIFPDGFLAEVEDIAGQFETERLALLNAIQGMVEASNTTPLFVDG